MDSKFAGQGAWARITRKEWIGAIVVVALVIVLAGTGLWKLVDVVMTQIGVGR